METPMKERETEGQAPQHRQKHSRAYWVGLAFLGGLCLYGFAFTLVEWFPFPPRFVLFD